MYVRFPTRSILSSLQRNPSNPNAKAQDQTISAARAANKDIASAVTKPNGCTSENSNSSASNDRCAIAEAVISEGMIRRRSIVSGGAYCLSCQHSFQRDGSSIPFRRQAKIRQPAAGASHGGNLLHVLI